MEYIKRINKMWTSDTLFLRETILVPCPAEDTQIGADGFTTLVIENETNGTSFPTLDVSCSEIPLVFPEVRLSSLNLQKKTSLAKTNSTSSTSSTSIDFDKSIHDYLGDIDSQIKEATSKAHKLQKTRYLYLANL